ncbi:FAD-dependent oxidoreductase [Streptomyces uncialis]|uniref:FAD-dependent oxidoreductase n=1 Tax=Streptomyces uncialis TaxID=1048205 RepID=UPI00386DAB0D|nr:FAD-binding protein [Streptomyces uncialis]
MSGRREPAGSDGGAAPDADVIVVGAGPAGLAVASTLAERYKVLVVDARPPRSDAPGESKVGRVHKSWFSPHDCLYDNPDIVHCRKPHGIRRYLIRTYSGASHGATDRFDLAWQPRQFDHAAPGDRYPYLDEYKLVEYWEGKLADSAHGSRVLRGRLYQEHRTAPDGVVVRFRPTPGTSGTAEREPATGPAAEHTGESYRCRLLLDASGHRSDIRKVYPDEQGHMYWWSVFGALVEHPEGDIGPPPGEGSGLAVGDYMLWQTFASTNTDPDTPLREGRPVFEYEILDERTSFCMLLYLRPVEVSLEKAKAEFVRVLHQEKSTAAFHRTTIKEYKFGHLPSGRGFRSFAQDRVDFIGDAGLWTTPSGWGASFILKNYVPYCRRLTPLLDEDRLDRASLRRLPTGHGKPAEFLMNCLATRFLAFGTVAQLDQYVQLFREIDPLMVEKIYTMRAGPRELWDFGRTAARTIGLRSLWTSLPRHERAQLLGDFARVIGQFTKESALQLTGRTPERGFAVYAEK